MVFLTRNLRDEYVSKIWSFHFPCKQKHSIEARKEGGKLNFNYYKRLQNDTVAWVSIFQVLTTKSALLIHAVWCCRLSLNSTVMRPAANFLFYKNRSGRIGGRFWGVVIWNIITVNKRESGLVAGGRETLETRVEFLLRSLRREWRMQFLLTLFLVRTNLFFVFFFSWNG